MSEQRDCPDCGVTNGQQHTDGCDVARCLWTGMQRLSCDYWLDYTDEPENAPLVINPDDPHRCGRDTWTGRWPGDEDAARLGFWCIWSGHGWVRVEADHPDATEDLNRLVIEALWDRRARRWEPAS